MKKKKIYFMSVILILMISLITMSGCESRENEKKEPNELDEVKSNYELSGVIDNSSDKDKNSKEISEKENKSNVGSTTDGKKTFEEKKVDKLSPVAWKYDNIDFSDLKWLNTDKYGNICIPNNWEKYSDVAMLTDEALAYGLSDSSQTIIIKDCKSSEANDEVQSILEKLANDITLEEWSYNQKKIDGRVAITVNAKFENINHVQSTMFIATPDQSRMIIVCIEAGDPNVSNLLDSYVFEKSNEEATSYFESLTR